MRYKTRHHLNHRPSIEGHKGIKLAAQGTDRSQGTHQAFDIIRHRPSIWNHNAQTKHLTSYLGTDHKHWAS